MNDSFSQEVKNELCSVRVKARCCRASLLRGMLCGASEDSENRLRFESENNAVLLLYIRLVREFCRDKKASDASLTCLNDPEQIEALKRAIGAEEGSDGQVFRACTECPWAFVRGAFLACGTITAPRNAYHLEFLARREENAFGLRECLSFLGYPAKEASRGALYGLYYKDSETVTDLLGHMGANRAIFQFLDVKMYRQLRNDVNRAANCETANLGKTVAASGEQMRAIQVLISSGLAETLPEELRETLDLRAAFPDDTLAELAGRHRPPITKSGVNHRLKKLIEIASKC